jgi:hypothetical protein
MKLRRMRRGKEERVYVTDRPLGRSRRRWMDNIKMDLVEIRLVMWTAMAWLRIGTSVELLDIEGGSI